MAKKNQNQDVTEVKAMTITEAVVFARSCMSDGKKPTNEEAKKARENASFAMAVDAVAQKFGETDKGARNRASFPTITDEEWKLLPFAKREWKTGRWPYINGHPTHPMTSVLTREEAEDYYKAQEENAGKGTAHGPRLMPIEEEVASVKTFKQAWEDAQEVKKAGLTAIAERMEHALPELKAPRLHEFFSGNEAFVITGKVKPSLAWLMCRNKDGESSPKREADMATLMAEGFFPTVMKPELDRQVAEFKEVGLDITQWIDGWL